MKAKIYCKNQSYNGISAGVNFVDGVGETDIPHLVDWFRERGYTVEDIYEPEDIESLSYKQLTEYAKSLGFNGIGLKRETLIEEISKLVGGEADAGIDEVITGV